MSRIIIAVIIIALLAIAVSVFIYRYQILQYTAETLIRKYLPDYIRIDKIIFDARENDLLLGGFKVLNPPGFSKEYLLEIEKIEFHYKMRGKSIIDGIELTSPVLTGALLNIERLGNSKVNLVEVQTLIEKVKEPGEQKGLQGSPAQAAQSKRLAGEVKLPETFIIKSGKIIFADRMINANPNLITFEDINTEIVLKMNEYYTKMLAISSTGAGYLNGNKGQAVKWNIGLNPTTPRLTMSSRFEVSNMPIVPFEPYYDKYSPLVFKAGRFSGLLIFDFDNGNIGSSDEIRLSGIKFFIKQGYENAQFLETTVPDLVKYFTSPYGEIIFDFKIKGDMSDPKFFLGPKSKEALISMAVDKISAAIEKNAGSGGAASGNSISKAQQYMDLFKGLIKK